MSFTLLLKLRAKRTFLCLLRSVPKAFALQSVLLLAFIFSSEYLSHEADISLRTLSTLAVAILLIAWIVCFAAEVVKYAPNLAYHRYDDDIIKQAFTGFDRKSAAFENALEMFHRGNFRHSLEAFTDMEDGRYELTQREKAVLEFYRGRCYNILGIYPNAVLCYDNAESGGINYPIIRLFIARCCIGNGDTERAKRIYNELLDSDYEHSKLIRTEYGKLYLKLNDGQNALKWFQEAIDRHENYADALGGAAIAQNMLHNFKEGEELYRAAMLNNIDDPVNFSNYYKEVQAATLLERYTEVK